MYSLSNRKWFTDEYEKREINKLFGFRIFERVLNIAADSKKQQQQFVTWVFVVWTAQLERLVGI